jgi:putative transcriptional regulator
MSYDSIIKGLDEAIKISKGELAGRRHKIVIRPVSEYSKEEIKDLRKKLNLTQVTFAQIIGVSKKTIEAWESGINSPTGPARRIIGMLEENPDLLQKYNIVKS